MAITDHDIAQRAFASPEWRAAADALFQAAGVAVDVIDFGRQLSYSATPMSCAVCPLAATGKRDGLISCFDAPPPEHAETGRLVCRAGLAALYGRIMHADQVVAHVVMSGFVTSTRDRRALYEQAYSRMGSEESARRAIRALPVIARRQAEAFLSMALASAQTVFDATRERASAAERIEELRLFVSAGHQVVSTEKLDETTLSAITEEAIALIGGEAGAVLRPHGQNLKVIATALGWKGGVGALVPSASTAAGRALETKRTVIAPGRSGSSVLAMPLVLGDRALGVLEVRLPASALPLPQDRVARLSRFAGFIAIALEREDEREAVEHAMVGYAQLNELAAALGGTSDIASVAGLITSVVDKAFVFDVAGLVLTGWGRDLAELVVHGDVTQATIDTALEVAAGRDPSVEPFEEGVRVATHGGSVVEGDEAPDLATLVVDLRHNDLNVGYLFVARADGVHYTKQDHALLEGIAAHASSAFGRAALFMRVREEYAKTIAALSAMLDYGERAPRGHAGRVMEYAMAIGAAMNLDVESIEHLRFAGLLHDVGKTGVPEEILLKPSRLTEEEFERAKCHVEIGAEIVEQIEFLRSLTPIILHHHERWDGTGYPHGLKGEQIPLLARILCVADAFDAMTSERVYAKRLTIREAREEMQRASGSQFDPRVVDALFAVLDRMAIAGSTGLLAQVRHDHPELFA